uniref:DDE Tnp4 domain-containing protein n=1 Tax=Amphimedon queenslandica TaxID=400682 RepID=A0A1X7U089_AMPQE
QNGLTHNRHNYNYRLSRARRVVENAFGILGNRFRVLITPGALVPEKAEVIVLARCTLHNFYNHKQDLVQSILPIKVWILKMKILML